MKLEGTYKKIMKVYVYAISKNEEKFVERWVNSMQEADHIYVLDTGSTDNTVEKLKQKGVSVKVKKIKPWRFDIARNESLKLVPSEPSICVCTDLDEVFEPGWRQELEKVWKDNTNRCRYIYNWSIKNNKPEVSFYYEKIHSRFNFKWIYPVHEVLSYDYEENIVSTDKIILNHYPDSKKSRSQYLPLLELSVKEYPDSDRNRHYLGREYMYYHRYNDAIDTLISHLQMPNATWKDERSASMRFIARCYVELKRYDEAFMWLDKAIIEAPYLRDPYIEKAILCYRLEKYQDVVDLVNKALTIEINNRTYINEIFTYNNTPYDLLSIAYYNLEDYEKSFENVKIALDMEPDNERIKNNYHLIEAKRTK